MSEANVLTQEQVLSGVIRKVAAARTAVKKAEDRVEEIIKKATKNAQVKVDEANVVLEKAQNRLEVATKAYRNGEDINTALTAYDAELQEVQAANEQAAASEEE